MSHEMRFTYNHLSYHFILFLFRLILLHLHLDFFNTAAGECCMFVTLLCSFVPDLPFPFLILLPNTFVVLMANQGPQTLLLANKITQYVL